MSNKTMAFWPVASDRIGDISAGKIGSVEAENVSVEQLTALFGKPEIWEGKVTRHWTVKFEDSAVAMIYDYRGFRWSIGGGFYSNRELVASRINAIINTKKERGNKIMAKSFMSKVETLNERLESLLDTYFQTGNINNNLNDDINEVSEAFRNLGGELRDSFDNMPENLQGSEEAEKLEERSDACETLADKLEDYLKEKISEALSDIPFFEGE